MNSKTVDLLESINRNILKESIYDEKVEEYMDYIFTHKANVEKAWSYIKTIDNPYIQNNLEVLDNNIKNHDKSKFEDDEFDSYRKKYYPVNDEEANEVMDNIEDIFKLHYSRNPHHWEYWLDKDGNLDETRHNGDIDNDVMIAYIEMLCDWASFGLKQDNPREVRSWYINEKPKMTKWPKEQEIIEDILKQYIDLFPEKEENDDE